MLENCRKFKTHHTLPLITVNELLKSTVYIHALVQTAIPRRFQLVEKNFSIPQKIGIEKVENFVYLNYFLEHVIVKTYRRYKFLLLIYQIHSKFIA